MEKHLTLSMLDDKQKILAVESTDPRKAVSMILDEIQGYQYADKWRQFINALAKCGYETIVHLIKGYSSTNKEYHKECLNHLSPAIRERIQATDLILHLCAQDLLSDEDKEEIICRNTNSGNLAAVDMLLDRITRKQAYWYPRFIEALKETGNKDIADILEKGEMDVYKLANQHTSGEITSTSASCSLMIVPSMRSTHLADPPTLPSRLKWTSEINFRSSVCEGNVFKLRPSSSCPELCLICMQQTEDLTTQTRGENQKSQSTYEDCLLAEIAFNCANKDVMAGTAVCSETTGLHKIEHGSKYITNTQSEVKDYDTKQSRTDTKRVGQELNAATQMHSIQYVYSNMDGPADVRKKEYLALAGLLVPQDEEGYLKVEPSTSYEYVHEGYVAIPRDVFDDKYASKANMMRSQEEELEAMRAKKQMIKHKNEIMDDMLKEQEEITAELQRQRRLQKEMTIKEKESKALELAILNNEDVTETYFSEEELALRSEYKISALKRTLDFRDYSSQRSIIVESPNAGGYLLDIHTPRLPVKIFDMTGLNTNIKRIGSDKDSAVYSDYSAYAYSGSIHQNGVLGWIAQ